MCGNSAVGSDFENPNRTEPKSNGRTRSSGYRGFLGKPKFNSHLCSFNNGVILMMIKKNETGISCSSTFQTEINEDNKL
jgi:hypothetical protein